MISVWLNKILKIFLCVWVEISFWNTICLNHSHSNSCKVHLKRVTLRYAFVSINMNVHQPTRIAITSLNVSMFGAKFPHRKRAIITVPARTDPFREFLHQSGIQPSERLTLSRPQVSVPLKTPVYHGNIVSRGLKGASFRPHYAETRQTFGQPLINVPVLGLTNGSAPCMHPNCLGQSEGSIGFSTRGGYWPNIFCLYTDRNYFSKNLSEIYIVIDILENWSLYEVISVRIANHSRQKHFWKFSFCEVSNGNIKRVYFWWHNVSRCTRKVTTMYYWYCACFVMQASCVAAVNKYFRWPKTGLHLSCWPNPIFLHSA